MPVEPYFTVGEFRAHVADLSTGVGDGAIEELRAHVEGVFERSAGRAFVTRSKTERIRGDAQATYILGEHDAQAVTSVTVDGVAVAGASIDECGMLEMPASVPIRAVIAVTYTYGMSPAPAQLKRLALLFAESLV